MISGQEVTTTDLVSLLRALPGTRFHLTGSRFFGNAKKDADWDFFAGEPLTGGVFTMLRALGFEEVNMYHEDERRDIFVVRIFRHPTLKVDICFIHPSWVLLKKQVQFVMRETKQKIPSKGPKRVEFWNRWLSVFVAMDAQDGIIDPLV